MKRAFITGITGQDGAYLADLLIGKGYEVYGGTRRSSERSFWRLKYLNILDKVNLIDFDLTDRINIFEAYSSHSFDEVYNLGAMSFVGTSFLQPELTRETDYMGVVYQLDAIKQYNQKAKFYQASTSEMFGKVQEVPQKETTPFYPRSPYGRAKLSAFWEVVGAREADNLFACNGILFNHESELRGEEFVTQKIISYVHKVKNFISMTDDKITPLQLGNLNAKRDWGHAKDYVEAMYLMMQQETPDDYVIASGSTYTVREFVELAFKKIGIDLRWKGEGENEHGYDLTTGKVWVQVSPLFFRPTEVDLLIGDPSKAKEKLGWNGTCSLDILIERMFSNYAHTK